MESGVVGDEMLWEALRPGVRTKNPKKRDAQLRGGSNGEGYVGSRKKTGKSPIEALKIHRVRDRCHGSEAAKRSN